MSIKKAEKSKKKKRERKNWGSRTGSRKGTRLGGPEGVPEGVQKGIQKASKWESRLGVHILYQPQPQDKGKKTCNCRNKQECQLEGECLVSDVVYQATVKTQTHKNVHRLNIKPFLRHDIETTRCHLGTLRGKTRQNSANSCGGWRWRWRFHCHVEDCCKGKAIITDLTKPL